MRLLLDTHAFLWAISDDARLGNSSRQLVFEQAEAQLTGPWMTHLLIDTARRPPRL